MKKRRNQDLAAIFAILALVCHFTTFAFKHKLPVLQTRLSLMEQEKHPSQDLINGTAADLRFYKLTNRSLEIAALLIGLISVLFCWQSIKAGESGALVTLGVLVVIFLVASRMH